MKEKLIKVIGNFNSIVTILNDSLVYSARHVELKVYFPLHDALLGNREFALAYR